MENKCYNALSTEVTKKGSQEYEFEDLVNETEQSNINGMALTYIRRYKSDWQYLHNWRQPLPDDELKIKCTACNSFLACRKSSLDEHAKTFKHKLNAGTVDIFDGFDFQKAISEIKVSIMVVDTQIPFLFIGRVLPYLKNTFFDSQLLKNVSLHRAKVSLILANVIAPAHKKRLAEILKMTKFCVLIDESTDVSNQSLLCIVIRYFDDQIGRIHDSLWDIVPAFDGDENQKVDAQTIVDKVISTFNSDNVPLNNIFAFCSDTCNLMMGNRSSVSTKLMEIIPGIRIVKCSAHIQHLCAQDALKIVPSIYNQIVHQLHNYFAHSSKRLYRFDVLQIKSGVPALKILKPANTRWLSYFQCINRILSRWTVLIQYFESECLEGDQLAAAKPLLDYLIYQQTISFIITFCIFTIAEGKLKVAIRKAERLRQ